MLKSHILGGPWNLLAAVCGLINTGSLFSLPALVFIRRSILTVISLLAVLLLFFRADTEAQQAGAQSSSQPSTILPDQFGGWQIQAAARSSTDPAVADPANAAILKEYHFSIVSSATYTRDDGRTLKVRAAKFADASGAFGAYTFYLQPEMRKEQIGDQAASLGERVLFYRGDIVVDALFSRESVMSGAELRELAGALPSPTGSSANLPGFIEFLPRRDYVPNTQKYIMGPLALGTFSPAVSADLVDFGVSSEVTLAQYSLPSGAATLMLISYPTPQLAADHLKRIDAAHQLALPQAGISEIEDKGSFFDKRTGPIIAVATGPVSEKDAKALLGMVNYEATVTWNTPTDNGQARELYQLILNVVIICAVIGGLAIIAGVAFGGFRILMKRLYPDKIFDRPEQMEFISLHLTETIVEEISQSGADDGRQAPQNPSGAA